MAEVGKYRLIETWDVLKWLVCTNPLDRLCD